MGAQPRSKEKPERGRSQGQGGQGRESQKGQERRKAGPRERRTDGNTRPSGQSQGEPTEPEAPGGPSSKSGGGRARREGEGAGKAPRSASMHLLICWICLWGSSQVLCKRSQWNFSVRRSRYGKNRLTRLQRTSHCSVGTELRLGTTIDVQCMSNGWFSNG